MRLALWTAQVRNEGLASLLAAGSWVAMLLSAIAAVGALERVRTLGAWCLFVTWGLLAAMLLVLALVA